jgi:hypothetical protein
VRRVLFAYWLLIGRVFQCMRFGQGVNSEVVQLASGRSDSSLRSNENILKILELRPFDVRANIPPVLSEPG